MGKTAAMRTAEPDWLVYDSGIFTLMCVESSPALGITRLSDCMFPENSGVMLDIAYIMLR